MENVECRTGKSSYFLPPSLSQSNISWDVVLTKGMDSTFTLHSPAEMAQPSSQWPGLWKYMHPVAQDKQKSHQVSQDPQPRVCQANCNFAFSDDIFSDSIRRFDHHRRNCNSTMSNAKSLPF